MNRLLVVVPAWVLGDGAVAPPTCGDRAGYHLAFHEHDDVDGPDPTSQLVTAGTHSYAEPRPRRDHTGTRQPAWPTTLHGEGWSAHWSAPRELHGVHHLTGRLLVDPMLSSQPATRGTVVDLAVISVEIEARDGRTPRGTVPGSHALEPIWSSPRWFDNGPTTTPTRSGWHSYSDLEPDGRYRRQAGVLVTLHLEESEVGTAGPSDPERLHLR